MGRPHRAAEAGYVYHVLNRANARMTIFADKGDYQAFERVLAEAVERDPLVEEAWDALAKTALQRPGIPQDRKRRESIAIFTRALSHDRGYVPLLLGRGQMHMAFVYEQIEQGEDPAEEAGAGAFLKAYRGQLATDGVPAPRREREAWSAFCQALFASAEFQYRK